MSSGQHSMAPFVLIYLSRVPFSPVLFPASLSDRYQMSSCQQCFSRNCLDMAIPYLFKYILNHKSEKKVRRKHGHSAEAEGEGEPHCQSRKLGLCQTNGISSVKNKLTMNLLLGVEAFALIGPLPRPLCFSCSQ
jgi:hypothetical protein